MKVISITPEIRQKLLQDFAQQLDSTKTGIPSVFTIAVAGKVPQEKPVIRIMDTAWAKMCMLVSHCSTEIAWHGYVTRNENSFTIEDIISYPQTVSGASVTTDDEAYSKWNLSQSSEEVSKTRLQGHSHVNMGVTPSGVDYEYYDKLIQLVPKDSFYIFCIGNKQKDWTWILYDFKNNARYENDEIDIRLILDDGTDLLDWADQTMKDNLSERIYQSNYGKGVYNPPNLLEDDYDERLLIPENKALSKKDYIYARKKHECPHCGTQRQHNHAKICRYCANPLEHRSERAGKK